MEESNYKHNYEYLSIEEAKTIVNGTFVQGTTNIGGELATKDDIDHLVDDANKRLTSIVPVTDTSNEFICFFECEDIETFPDEWTYVFHYDVSGTSGSSSTPTSWTKQYNVDGQQINNNLVLNGITSYKIKTGSLGTVQRENVSYSGQVGSPSGYNYSEQEATGSGHLTQNGSGKQLQWSYTQNANVKVWNISADKTSLSFPANGGTRSVQITTWYTWQYNNNNNQKFDQNTTTENITAEANTLQQQKTWTKVITKNNKSVSIQCTQEGAQEQFPDDLQHRWIRVQPESSQISVDGGTINVTGSYGLTGTFGTERKVGDITDTIVVESNSTQGQKSSSKTYHYNNNQSDTPTAKITWTQPGRAEEFPDDEAHRWINISPTQFNFPADGGSVNITGSYGLTGTFGTRREVGTISDTITVEANNTESSKSGSKTYYYNNDQSQQPTTNFSWTQPNQVFTYKYKIGFVETPESTNISSYKTVVWQSDQYDKGSKKKVYVKASRQKINSHNQVVSSEDYHFVIDNNYLGDFHVDVLENSIECYPTLKNTDYNNKKTTKIKCFIQEDKDVSCELICIQERKDVQIISGDAIMFTYNWDKGVDLDQATFVNLNLREDKYNNYAGYYGKIIDQYKNILYFAGDNTGKGNEYAFIDFKNISKYLNEHRDDQSSITGKTIMQSLTGDNGEIKVECYLYTNWFNEKESENITLSYSVYNKDSEDATVTKDNSNSQFVITGYTKINDSLYQALCYAKGKKNVWNGVNVKDGYTLSAKFTYYLNSGVLAFETNKDNVNKWHKGTVLTEVTCDPSRSNLLFTKDDNNINFSITIDSLNQPEYFDKNKEVTFTVRIYQELLTTNYAIMGFRTVPINQIPYKIELSMPLSDIIKEMNFIDANSIKVFPEVATNSDSVINYSEEKYLNVKDITLNLNTLVLQKQNS